MLVFTLAACAALQPPPLQRRAVLSLAATAAWPLKASAAQQTFVTAPSGVQWSELKVGSGEPPRAKERVVVDYVMTRRGGAKIHSTRQQGIPFSWIVGDGRVIAGLEQAVAGGAGVPPMLPGGVRRVIVPQELGYGIREGDWTTTLRDGLGPIPPDDFDWVDTNGEYVNSFKRFKNIYQNTNRMAQPDLVFDILFLRKEGAAVAPEPPAAASSVADADAAPAAAASSEGAADPRS